MDSLPFPFSFLYKVYEEIRFRLYFGPVFHRFLNHKYPYYTHLPAPLKLKFLRLVRDHYEYFEFIPRNGMKLTRAMKAIICSAASQVVMFLPPESLTYFEKILVYPDDYTSVHTNKAHRGEVNPGLRVIVFTWTGIAEGIARPDDGLNLMLHEFAHALWLEHKLVPHRYTILKERLVGQFEGLAEAEMDKIHASETHFFRAYAFTNIEEFFAVAVENFFERPGGFKVEIPRMYDVLVRLFGQDPLLLDTRNGKTK